MQYHFPSEAPGLEDPIRAELAELGAELVEAVGQQRDEGKSKSYHIKAISITDSPWQEVIYLVSLLLTADKGVASLLTHLGLRLYPTRRS